MARTGDIMDLHALLPPAAVAFLQRRSFEAAGVSLFVLAACILAALITFTPGDPSLNAASAGEPSNAMGAMGAATADLLLQVFGVAGAMPAVILAAWGWRLVRKETVNLLWLRIVFTLGGIILLAIGLGALPTPGGWPLRSGMGGVSGTLLLQHLYNGWLALFPALFGWFIISVIAFFAAALGISALVFGLGLSGSEWRAFGRGAGQAATVSVRKGLALRRFAPGANQRVEPSLDPHDDELPLPRRAARETKKRSPDLPSLVVPKVSKPKTSRRAQAERQPTLDLGTEGEDYGLPPLGLLTLPPDARARKALSADALEKNARMLEGVLDDFGVKGEIVKVRPGPVVTLYELEPAPGTKTSRVISLSDDIARSMAAVSVRVAVIPGRNVIGIELPNHDREMVYMRELLESEAYDRAAGKLTLVLGKDIGGAPVMVDLTRMPHLLVAGTTGSGKSVAINTMILSLLYRLGPEQCRFIMVDPKMLELSVYDGIPHLLSPVVTDPSKAVVALKWTVREMEDRYKVMAQLGVR
ncbi:MAG: DNA translocase FtsK 4TM domain-containing protein, partial [Rhodospirillales bacterium]|nr:DNA translocase FtsK 4TM domain-containing protein [Rhodospirillales bacterium]